MAPAEGGPKTLTFQSSWHRRRRSKNLAVRLKHWRGRRGGGSRGVIPLLLRCTAVLIHPSGGLTQNVTPGHCARTQRHPTVCCVVLCCVVLCCVVLCCVVLCCVVLCCVVLCCVVLCCVVLCCVVLCCVVLCCVVLCCVVLCCVVLCCVVLCCVVLCCVVLCCVVSWCGVVWCGVPKALLPKGKRPGCLPTGKGKRAGLCVLCARRA